MTTELTFPGSIAGMNGSKGLIRTHWARKKAMKNYYHYHVKSQTSNAHPGPVKLSLTRYSTGVEMDYDNLVSTGKNLIDSIVSAGVIKDDKKSIIQQREYEQIKCKKGEQRTVIIITDL